MLDAASPEPERHAQLTELVAQHVAAAVVEIAVLDRVTDPFDFDVICTYGRLIVQALGLEEEPRRGFRLWEETARAPLSQFAEQWLQHMERAARESESRHHHVRLVDLEQISRALDLTRQRFKAVFGSEKCSLPPIRLKDPTFSTDEQREIRALAQRVGLSAERLRDLALTLDPAEFCDRILLRELLILPDIDQHRMLNSSDVSVSRSIRRFCKPARPGPKPKANTRTAQIGAVAQHRRVSTDTIKRMVTDYHAWLEAPAIADPAVTLHQNHRHVASKSSTGGFRDFEAVIHTALPEFLILHGVKISEADLLAIASLPQHKGPRARVGRMRYTYADKDLVIAWWQATRNQTPSPDQIRQWASRGHYQGYRASALLWKKEQDLRDREDNEHK